MNCTFEKKSWSNRFANWSVEWRVYGTYTYICVFDYSFALLTAIQQQRIKKENGKSKHQEYHNGNGFNNKYADGYYLLLLGCINIKGTNKWLDQRFHDETK